jgi:hypothetical protein
MKHQGQRLTLKTAENNKQQETTKGIHHSREIVFLKEYYYFASLHIRVIQCRMCLKIGSSFFICCIVSLYLQSKMPTVPVSEGKTTLAKTTKIIY